MLSFKQKSPLISKGTAYQLFWFNVCTVQDIEIFYLETTVLVLKSKNVFPKEKLQLNVQTVPKQNREGLI